MKIANVAQHWLRSLLVSDLQKKMDFPKKQKYEHTTTPTHPKKIKKETHTQINQQKQTQTQINTHTQIYQQKHKLKKPHIPQPHHDSTVVMDSFLWVFKARQAAPWIRCAYAPHLPGHSVEA